MNISSHHRRVRRRGGPATLLAGVCAASIVVSVPPPRSSAQVCSWGGTPTVVPPVVEHLSSSSEGLRAPTRLAVDSADRILVAEPTTGSVVVRDAGGGVVGTYGNLGTPAAVAVDAFDNVYVADLSTGAVRILDPSWQSVGSLGGGPGEFESVTDIAVDPDLGTGEVYVANCGDLQNISVFNTHGKYLRSIGRKGGRPRVGLYRNDGILDPAQPRIALGLAFATALKAHFPDDRYGTFRM